MPHLPHSRAEASAAAHAAAAAAAAAAARAMHGVHLPRQLHRSNQTEGGGAGGQPEHEDTDWHAEQRLNTFPAQLDAALFHALGVFRTDFGGDAAAGRADDHRAVPAACGCCEGLYHSLGLVLALLLCALARWCSRGGLNDELLAGGGGGGGGAWYEPECRPRQGPQGGAGGWTAGTPGVHGCGAFAPASKSVSSLEAFAAADFTAQVAAQAEKAGFDAALVCCKMVRRERRIDFFELLGFATGNALAAWWLLTAVARCVMARGESEERRQMAEAQFGGGGGGGDGGGGGGGGRARKGGGVLIKRIALRNRIGSRASSRGRPNAASVVPSATEPAHLNNL